MIRVLVVDDAEFVRERICMMLAEDNEFFLVGQASSASEAIEQAKEHQPDVVLLDIGMPGRNGYQAAPLIKNAAPQTEILIVTQYSNPIVAGQAFALGARGFLTKSDAGLELATAVREVFAKRKFVSRSLALAA